MEVLTQDALRLRREEFSEKIKAGCLFIHPTDTIYGIGCNALDAKAVAKIRELKGRPTSPLSIWVPQKLWIKKNCSLSKEAKEWLAKLPGPYTLILALKNVKAVAKEVIPTTHNLGVRLPNHWFSSFVETLGIPIITTSANKGGEPFMTRLESLDPDIERACEFMVYEGVKEARHSTIVNLEKNELIKR